MSKRDTYGRKVACPFFHSAGVKSIKCEGLLPRTYTCHVFFKEADCAQHIFTICAGDCERCFHYRALMRSRYRNDNNNNN